MKYTLPFSILLLFFSFNARAQYLTFSSSIDGQLSNDITTAPFVSLKGGYLFKHFYIGGSFLHSLDKDKELKTTALGFGIKVLAYKPESKFNVFAEFNYLWPVFDSPEGYYYRDEWDYYHHIYYYHYIKKVNPTYSTVLGLSFKIKPFDIFLSIGAGRREYITIYGRSYENGLKDESERIGRITTLNGCVGVIYNLDLRKKEKKVEE